VGSLFKSVRPRAPKKRAPGTKGTTGRWLVLAVVVALSAAFASVASGDVIKNDIAINGPGQKATVDPGGTVTVDYFIHPTGGSCDAADGSTATVTINTPLGVTANPTSLTFNACGEANSQAVVFTAPDTPGDYKIPDVDVTDSHGQYSTGDTAFFITVADGDLGGGTPDPPVNLDPTADAGGPYSGTEGSAVSLSGSGTDTDGTIASYSWSYSVDSADAGTSCSFSDDTAASPTITCNDNGTFTVTLEVTDDQGGTGSDSASLSLDNANPSIDSLSNSGPIDEGSSASINASASDPGSNDTLSYAYDCNNDSTYEDTSGSCSFDDNGTYTVGVQVTDDNGGSTTGTTDVTVNNVPPTADLGNNGPINEGGSATVSFSNQSDPSTADTTAGFHYAFSCSNADLSGTTYAGGGTSDSTSCSFAQNGSYTVSGAIVDKDDGVSTYTTTVTVNNVAPSVGTPTVSSKSNCSVSISASFTDPGVLDTHTATINWGDGNTTAGTVSESNGSGTVTGSHTYLTPGVWSITVTVTDSDGGVGTSSGLSFDNNPTLAYPLPPIIAGKSFKTGSTIPVKVNVTGCTAGLAPTIWYQQDPNTTLVAPNPSGKSSKSLGAMRYDTGIPGYIYNWQTKGLAAGTYTVWIAGLPGAAFQYAVVTITK
jgi:PKD domain